MGERAGYIPAAVGGQQVHLAHTGFMFDADAEAMRALARLVAHRRADQWGVFFVGAMLGMVLPALLYVTFLPRGTDIQGLGISAALARGIGAHAGACSAAVIAFLGAWILFKTQLDSSEGMMRAITDILWTGSARLRAWRGGDVRAVYYSVLRRRALGHHRAAAGAADRAAADRRQHRRRVRRRLAAPALRQHAAPAGARAAADVAAPVSPAASVSRCCTVSLAIGTMSIVAPTTAVCAVMLPVLVEALRGERLPPMTQGGIGLAVVAIVLVSQQDSAESAGAGSTRRVIPPGIGLAFMSGVAIGLFFLALARTSAAAGLWPLFASRGLSMVIFGAIAAARVQRLRLDSEVLKIAVTCGVVDMLANALYLLASR